MTMKTDAFTLTVVLALIISVFTVGIVFLIAQNNLGNIPSVERGLIVSKKVLTANDSVIGLSDGKTLYISNNTPLYLSLQENKTYVFNCLLNYQTKITYIETATIENSTNT